MKLFIHYKDAWNVLPCGDGENKVSWIISEMKTRLQIVQDEIVCQIMLENGKPGQLNKDDRIKDVLQDKDFVYLGKDFLL